VIPGLHERDHEEVPPELLNSMETVQATRLTRYLSAAVRPDQAILEQTFTMVLR